MNTHELENYWSERYTNKHTGWDIGYPSTPIKEYVDQLKDKDTRILIPGAGNSYEAEYLHKQGFNNVHVLDISRHPLNTFKMRVPSFPEEHLLHGNFFEHQGEYELILEQTFFCSFEPSKENRHSYAKQMAKLLAANGLLVGLWFAIELEKDSKRPFGGTKEEYLTYLEPYFEVQVFENCYNSIPPRAGNELFGIFVRK